MRADTRPTRRVGLGIPVEIGEWAAVEAKKLGMSRSQYVTLLLYKERGTQVHERMERLEERVKDIESFLNI